MSFFFTNTLPQAVPANKVSKDVATLHRLGCRACPLNKIDTNKHPHLAATGSANPLVYMLGEAPGEAEDVKGRQFVGRAGKFLREHIPAQFDHRVRWNYVVRTKPPKGRSPTNNEIECCRPSVIADIEETRPKAIIGFGPVPLEWVVPGETVISKWRGRRMQVRIGKHTCWFYSVMDPAAVLTAKDKTTYGTHTSEEGFRFDLRKLFNEIETLPDAEPEDLTNLYQGIETYWGGEDGLKKIKDFLSEIKHKKMVIGFDYESNGLRPYNKGRKVLSLALSGFGRTVAFAIDHKGAKWTKAQRDELVEAWETFLTERTCRLVAHNLAFELEWTGFFYGWDKLRAGPWGDTQAQAYTLDERAMKGALSLDEVCFRQFGFWLKSQSDVDVKNLDDEPVEKVLRYNGLDAKYTVGTYLRQHEELKTDGTMATYREQIRRAVTIAHTQRKGILIDRAFVEQSRAYMDMQIGKFERKIKSAKEVERVETACNEKFNIDSKDHLTVLFEKVLKIPAKRRTPSGQYAVDEETLKQINHPIAKNIIQYRKASKLKATYLDNMAVIGERDLYDDGRVHPNFKSMFTSTGRLSSTGPNIQNQPRRKNVELIRPAFVASPGHTFVAVDYGQIEARVIAMAAKDPRFIRALWTKYDTHKEWAERIAKKYPASVGGKQFINDPAKIKELRDKVKNKWVFPAFYGAAKNSLSGYMDLPMDITTETYDEFWQVFSGIRKWQRNQLKFYNDNGYVEMMTKRRRRGPIGWSQFLNSPIQGTASDLVIDAMNRLSELAEERDEPWLQPMLNVHDDLSFDVPNEELDDALDVIVTEMLRFDFDFINVPISVELKLGPNWYDLSPVGDFFSNEWPACGMPTKMEERYAA